MKRIMEYTNTKEEHPSQDGVGVHRWKIGPLEMSDLSSMCRSSCCGSSAHVHRQIWSLPLWILFLDVFLSALHQFHCNIATIVVAIALARDRSNFSNTDCNISQGESHIAFQITMGVEKESKFRVNQILSEDVANR